MTRADLLVVERGLAASRSQAQRLIAAGQVQWQVPGAAWSPVAKAGQLLPPDCALQVDAGSETRFVSRGGLKLDVALVHTGLAVQGLHCLDIGQSTGGFTDCLLQHGAARVVGVDVGHGQLHARLRADPRVCCIEKQNARHLDAAQVLEHNHGEAFGLVVLDVSFISQTLLLDAIRAVLAPGGRVLALVKPQFEAGPDAINRQGLVKKKDAHLLVEQRIREAYVEKGFEVLDFFPSAITGGDGNREYFILACGAQNL